MMHATNLVEKIFLGKELLLNWLEEPHMEEIENAGEMAGVEDDTTVEDETEIGTDVVVQYGLINTVHQRGPITG